MVCNSRRLSYHFGATVALVALLGLMISNPQLQVAQNRILVGVCPARDDDLIEALAHDLRIDSTVNPITVGACIREKPVVEAHDKVALSAGKESIDSECNFSAAAIRRIRRKRRFMISTSSAVASPPMAVVLNVGR